MQNIIEICKEFGMEVPADKQAEFNKKVSENYRTKSDYDKAIEKRDEYKTSLDDVQKKLDAFKNVDVEDLKGQIDTLTTQLADEKAERAKDAAKAELEKSVRTFLSSTDDKGDRLYDFLNDITETYYRNALMEELEKDSAKGKSIEDIFKGMITDKDGNQKEGIFVNKAEQNKARFTKPNKPGSGAMTDKQKFASMSLDERMKLKASDPELYKSMRNS